MRSLFPAFVCLFAQVVPACVGAENNVETLVEQAKKSVVQITFSGRDGKQQGLGTGFIISADGLIATNLHVVGEARPITVELSDKRELPVKVVYASDRVLDLALLKVDAKDLPALPLADSDKVKDGQPIVTLGNPLGLKYSVVTGVVSGRREMDGRQMLQIAMPIEPGNSGGPVLNARGEVLGVVTMKSLVTNNLGFAVAINHLKPLIEKPNPVPMSKWLTIGALDRRKWKPLHGGSWKQEAGKLVATGVGDDYIGKRMLCVRNGDLPELPFEIAVSVRLDDESGAAGLIFHSDKNDKHYGFYPSRGRLRLSRFEGPSVFSWQVLEEIESDAYRPGQWNHLKVRFEKGKFLCFVNDQKVVESTDSALMAGHVGLAKFREPSAQFKQFQIAATIAPIKTDPKIRELVEQQIARLPSLANVRKADLDSLVTNSKVGSDTLRDRAELLEKQAADFRKLAADVHTLAIVKSLGEVTKRDDDKIDLLSASLLIAKLDNQELDERVYVDQVAGMVEEIRGEFPKDATERQKLAVLNRYLFESNGFHGSRTNYYHRANSYLNQVLDDREGLPITLSVLYMELGRRLGLRIEGIGLPGHFVVRQVANNGDKQLVDVFDGGKLISDADAGRIVREFAGREIVDEDLKPNSRRAILQRILRNLMGIAQRDGDKEAMLRYVEALLAIEPDTPSERGMRAVLRFETGRRDGAVADLDWFLATEPEGLDLERIRQMREMFLRGR